MMALGFLIGQVFDALQGCEVKFNPDTLVLGIEKAVGVATKSMHVAVRIGDTARAHGDGNLMQELRAIMSKNPSCCLHYACWYADHVLQRGLSRETSMDRVRRIRACCFPPNPSYRLRYKHFMAKPRMSRSASAAPRSPATVEKRTKHSVCLPTSLNMAARVYLLMS